MGAIGRACAGTEKLESGKKEADNEDDDNEPPRIEWRGAPTNCDFEGSTPSESVAIASRFLQTAKLVPAATGRGFIIRSDPPPQRRATAALT